MDNITYQVHQDQGENQINQHILSRYIPKEKQRIQGYFYENTCCILRWTNIGQKFFYSIKHLNQWIETHSHEYDTCTYLYIYERSHDFPLYFPSQLQLLDVRFSKITYPNLPQFPTTLRNINMFKCSQLQVFDILDCADKCPDLEELILYACGIHQIYFPLETQNIPEPQIIQKTKTDTNTDTNTDTDHRLQHQNLRFIELSLNHLISIDIPKQIPTNVSILHLDHNMLTSVIYPQSQNNNDMTIVLHGNELQYNTPLLQYLEYHHYALQNNYYHTHTYNPINQNTINQNTIYNKQQNVHSSSIQDSSNNSVKIIHDLYQLKLLTLDESFDNSVDDINHSFINKIRLFCLNKSNNNIKNKASKWQNSGWKNNLIAYFKDKTITNLIESADDEFVHSVHSLTMKEIIKRVWTIIALETDQKKKKEMAKVFKDELYHGKGLCFTGRFTRVVNCLCGFVEGINIEVSPLERLQAQTSALYNTLTKKTDDEIDIEKMLDELFAMLKDAHLLDKGGDFTEKAWPWIQPFCDMFISDEKRIQQHDIKSLAEKYIQIHDIK